jgi:hypothetical protein
MHALLALYVFALIAAMLTAVIGAYLLPPEDDV